MLAIDISVEHVRGDTHRHHHLDYHPISMNHGEVNYHDYLDGTIYDDIKSLKRGTRISALTVKIHDVITQMRNYQILNGPYNPNLRTWNYILRNMKKKINYSISIKADESFTCNCPAFINKPEVPCKHIIIVALVKNHEIKIGELI